MYADHVPIIAAAMRADVDVFARGVMFAILSARVQFPRVPAQCEELADKGDAANCLWGWKFDAYSYLQQHKERLHEQLLLDQQNLDWLLWTLTRIPGLGIVKAAFVLQLMGYDIACLDTINIQREGRNPRAYRSDGEKAKGGKAWERKIARYVKDTEGKAQFYWNQWCDDQAVKYALTSDAVSALHVTAIVPKSRQQAENIPF